MVTISERTPCRSYSIHFYTSRYGTFVGERKQAECQQHHGQNGSSILRTFLQKHVDRLNAALGTDGLPEAQLGPRPHGHVGDEQPGEEGGGQADGEAGEERVKESDPLQEEAPYGVAQGHGEVSDGHEESVAGGAVLLGGDVGQVQVGALRKAYVLSLIHI